MRPRIRKKIQKAMRCDGASACDICHEQAILIEHHINGRGGSDAEKPWNKCDACPNCHTDVHYGRRIIEGWVMTTDGLKLMWHWAGQESFTGRDAQPYVIPRPRQRASAAAPFGISKAG